MHKLIFATLPVSTNRLYVQAGRRRVLTQEAQHNRYLLIREARAQFKKDTIPGPIAVSIGVWWPTKRNHDIDNQVKAIFDAMKGILWDDDGQIVELRLTKGYDKENPRMELELSTVES